MGLIPKMALELIRQLFRKPVTNEFPVKYAPSSATKLMEKVEKGRVKINPPIELPPNFRGRLAYDSEKCTGCGLCVKVCPAMALELVEIVAAAAGDKKRKKIKHYVSRCTFCAQCVDVCPMKSLSMSNEFLLADYDKYSKGLVVE